MSTKPFPAVTTCGVRFGSSSSYDYPTPKKFNGEVNWAELDTAEAAEDTDHLISPDEPLRLVTAISSPLRTRARSPACVSGLLRIKRDFFKRSPSDLTWLELD